MARLDTSKGMNWLSRAAKRLAAVGFRTLSAQPSGLRTTSTAHVSPPQRLKELSDDAMAPENSKKGGAMAHEAHGLLQVRPYAASRRSPHVPTFACEAVLLVVAAYLLAPCGVTFVAAPGLAPQGRRKAPGLARRRRLLG